MLFASNPCAQDLAAAFIDDYRLLCVTKDHLELWDFAVESQPRKVIFWLRVGLSPKNIHRGYGPNDTGPFSANPESGIVVVIAKGTFDFYALVIPIDFFVGIMSEGNSGEVSWKKWKDFVVRVHSGGLIPHVFQTQLLLLHEGTGVFDVFDFSPYTRMEVEEGNGGYNRCGEEVMEFICKQKLAKPLATTCRVSFDLRGHTTYLVTGGGVLLPSVRTPTVAKRAGLLT